MNSQFGPVSKGEVVKVDADLEKIITETETEETGKQPADENQPTLANSANKAVEKHDNLESRGKVASASTWKLKSGRAKSPFSTFSVAMLLKLTLVFGSLAGSLAFSEINDGSQLESNVTPSEISATNAESVIQEIDVNRNTVDFVRLLQSVSELHRIVYNLQHEVQNSKNLADAALLQLAHNMSALEAQASDMQTQMKLVNNDANPTMSDKVSELQKQVKELLKFKNLHVGYTNCLGTNGVLTFDACYSRYAQKTFPEAKSFCENLGGTLPTNVDFNASRIQEIFKTIGRSWLGIQDLSNVTQDQSATCANKRRLWLNGEPVSHFFWMHGEPSCYSHKRIVENCVEVLPKGWGWNDVSCQRLNDFYCQFKAR